VVPAASSVMPHSQAEGIRSSENGFLHARPAARAGGAGRDASASRLGREEGGRHCRGCGRSGCGAALARVRALSGSRPAHRCCTEPTDQAGWRAFGMWDSGPWCRARIVLGAGDGGDDPRIARVGRVLRTPGSTSAKPVECRSG
jgi:hypothetical protein